MGKHFAMNFRMNDPRARTELPFLQLGRCQTSKTGELLALQKCLRHLGKAHSPGSSTMTCIADVLTGTGPSIAAVQSP